MKTSFIYFYVVQRCEECGAGCVPMPSNDFLFCLFVPGSVVRCTNCRSIQEK